MEIIYIGLIDNQFKYKVKLNGYTFDYSTGIGWHALGTKNPDSSQYVRVSQDEFKTIQESYTLKQQNWHWGRYGEPLKHIYRRKPAELDVLECLEMDVQAGQLSFNDFCDTFGYSNDSIKALDVYRACMDVAHKLMGYKFPEKEVS